MTREECEKAIADKTVEIWNIYKEYNPDGYYIELFANKDGLIQVNNEYWLNDINKPLTRNFNYK